MPDLPKVYLTSFQWLPPGDHVAVAVADDGELLAQHICSAPSFFRHDLHDIESRRDAYVRKYGRWGDGDRYQLVECPAAEVPAEVVERAEALLAAQEGDDA
jgi:hypothetical protein